MDDRDDSQLMAAVAAGDMEALGHLVRRHQDKALALAYRMLQRWDLAEDVCQDAFLRVYHSAKRYRPDALFTTWLYRIVVNLCIDAKRRTARAASSGDDIAATLDAPAEPDPIETSERAQAVRRAVASLPDRQQAAVVLHRYQGLPHRQIAEVMGLTESAVESLLVRAYAKLRKMLAEIET